MFDLSAFNVDLSKFAAVVAILVGVGKLLKTVPAISNAYIPILLFLLGVGAYPLAAELFTGGAFFVGAAAGLTAVGAHQNLVQAREVIKQADDKSQTP